MAQALTVVKTEAQPLKRKREQIGLIETMPNEGSFIRTTTSRGRVVWYLRFEVTGQHPRLYGPFRSKHHCLLFLDKALDAMADFESGIADACNEYMIDEPCAKIWPPIVEHPILTQPRRSTSMKGR